MSELEEVCSCPCPSTGPVQPYMFTPSQDAELAKPSKPDVGSDEESAVAGCFAVVVAECVGDQSCAKTERSRNGLQPAVTRSAVPIIGANRENV